MGFWESLRTFRYGIATKNDSVNGQPVQMEIDVFGIGSNDKKTFYSDSTKFVKLQKETFVLNNVFNKIASKLSSAQFTSESDNSEILDKINNPNDSQSKEEFLKEFTVFLLSSGWTAIWKKYKSFGNFKTLELINLNPDNTDIGKINLTTEIDGKSETILLTDVILFYDSVRNNKNKKGYSRITPLRTQINNIKDAQLAKGIQIENSGTTIVSPKQTAAGNNIDEGLNAPVPVMGGGIKTQKEEMEDRFSSRGLINRIIVSSKGLDAKNLSAELNTVKFHEIVETDILAVYDAYSFPVELSPYGKNATFENKEVAEVGLIENEVAPLAENLINSLNAEFPNKKPIDVHFNHLNSMSVIQERIQTTNGKTIDQYGVLFDKKIITESEYKEILKSKKILI
jgi:hypothetical protein